MNKTEHCTEQKFFYLYKTKNFYLYLMFKKKKDKLLLHF